MRRFNQLWVAGGFVQRAGTAAPSCLTGLQVSSSFVGNTTIRGIAAITSGTTVVSVAATGVVSGDVVLANLYMYNQTYNGSKFVTITVQSVRAGAFEVATVGSVAPVGTANVAWFVVK